MSKDNKLDYLQLGRSSPRGIETARRVGVGIVLLNAGRDGIGDDRRRGCRSTLNGPVRSADLTLQQRSSRLTGNLLLFLRRAEVLQTPAPALLDGRVLRRWHQLLLQLATRNVTAKDTRQIRRDSNTECSY